MRFAGKNQPQARDVHHQFQLLLKKHLALNTKFQRSSIPGRNVVGLRTYSRRYLSGTMSVAPTVVKMATTELKTGGSPAHDEEKEN